MISIVIPVYNGAESLEELYDRIKEVMGKKGLDFEIIMVDDFSRDESYKMMCRLREKDKRVKLIRLAFNSGQHNATLCGMRYCSGDYVITMDDDLQHPPEEIVKLIDKIEEGYDIVFGIAEDKKHSFYRNLGNRLIDKSLNVIYDKPPDLKVSSFRIIRKGLAELLSNCKRKEIYLAGLIFENTSNTACIKVKHDARKYGRSNYSIKKAARLALNLVFNHSDLPLKITVFIWLVFFTVLSIASVLLFVAPMKYFFDKLAFIILWFLTLLNLLSFLVTARYIKGLRREMLNDKPPYEIKELQL